MRATPARAAAAASGGSSVHSVNSIGRSAARWSEAIRNSVVRRGQSPLVRVAVLIEPVEEVQKRAIRGAEALHAVPDAGRDRDQRGSRPIEEELTDSPKRRRTLAAIEQDELDATLHDKNAVELGFVAVPGAHRAGAQAHVEGLRNRRCAGLPVTAIHFGGEAVAGDDIAHLADLYAGGQCAQLRAFRGHGRLVLAGSLQHPFVSHRCRSNSTRLPGTNAGCCRSSSTTTGPG